MDQGRCGDKTRNTIFQYISENMKANKSSTDSAAKAALVSMIDKAAGFRRKAHGPEPERLKITGFKKWEDAAAALARAKKPSGGWPKR